ncbi:MAG: archease [Actinomycetota bacterium]|nr:archease [Actinomycetota bacterium]
MKGFEIIEHTADVGVRATGASLEEVFEQTTLGLLDIAGAWNPASSAAPPIPIEIEAGDLGALLVEWLGEILYLQEARDSVVTHLAVSHVGDGRATGSVTLEPRGDRVLEGTAVKAITYHEVKVEQVGDVWEAQIYVDV